MRILVTGGAGFIASHLVDALLERGHTLSVVDNLYSGSRANVDARARLHVVDVTTDDLADVFDRERPEVVFHHAAQMDVKKSVIDPRFDARVNVLGGVNLYENCRRTGVRKIVFASSGGTVYGDAETVPTKEDAPKRPTSPYGISKLANEHYLFYYEIVHAIRTIALRYANVYGPRQNPHGEAGVVAIFAAKLLAGETPTINGTGNQTRDYVHVRDVVAANIAALEYDGTGAFNVGTGSETDVNRIFALLRKSIGSDVDAPHGPAKAGEQMRSALDCTLARKKLGWKPAVSLDDGIAETVAWFRERSGR